MYGDEIQVQLKGGENRRLLQHVGVARIVVVVGFDLLGIIGSIAQEDGDARQAEDPVQGGKAGDKQADQREYEQEHQSSEKDGAQPGQVCLGKIAVGSQHREISRSGQEYENQAPKLKDIQVHGHGEAEQG